MTDHNNTFGATMNKALKDDGDDFLNMALKKWKFNSKYKRNQIIFICLLVFFLTFGSVFTYYYTQIQQIKEQYDNQCSLNTRCQIQIDITQKMTQPIFFYYEIDNFYQTNRKFYQSKDTLQLKGEDRTISQLSSCAPYVTNQDMGKTLSFTGQTLNPQDPAIPCGLLSKLYFNDTYQLQSQNGTLIQIDQSQIAWTVDIDYNYKQTSDAPQKAWVDVTDEHFMVWMRTSGMGTFKKLWGRIKQDLPAGVYKLTINNQYNTSEYNGQKFFIITTSSPFGQKNIVLIVAYFSGALICIISVVSLYFFNKAKKDK
ncbi:ligand-effect modulator 3 LEM3 family protein (macronuclear) [Tetrahymena thermophila SB210]|uniref:Ligand-effect modulator 3 LEM3 family protein n=1 Tax=Tetrahymena thermophila (strain SB210) TaxID=312017 RepID=Q22CJ1_TETTS|nr:ligand-effect modulator 3 LEM3 family protein [Tetrahymena thermophila SB210]EAR83001.2 ligand-effect modulator 3 LEM3 family protein [Tetrahymena thermophila SB210]|eukprot:XP_001030664.2 ligand-effect modulator 3 LEM3 family protein [Tetrahymena thermophila SB210]